MEKVRFGWVREGVRVFWSSLSSKDFWRILALPYFDKRGYLGCVKNYIRAVVDVLMNSDRGGRFLPLELRKGESGAQVVRTDFDFCKETILYSWSRVLAFCLGFPMQDFFICGFMVNYMRFKSWKLKYLKKIL